MTHDDDMYSDVKAGPTVDLLMKQRYTNKPLDHTLQAVPAMTRNTIVNTTAQTIAQTKIFPRRNDQVYNTIVF